MRQRLPGGAPLAVLLAAVAGVVAYVLTYALDTTAFLNDEYGNVTGGRLMARDPWDSLTATSGTVFGRGPERLASVVLGVPSAIFTSGADQLRAGHVLLASAYALVAVPAYALLRGLAVPAWPAVGLAVAVILGPWMVFGTTLLNNTLAAPLFVLFVFAAWRAVVRPSLRTEALALGAAALMTTARASQATYFAAAIVAAILCAWWTREPGEGLLRLPARFARRTPLIFGAATLGLLLLAVFGPSALAGRDYANAAQLRLPFDAIENALGWTTAMLTIATGFVPVLVGGAWALRQIARPTDLGAGAFAVLAVGTFLVFVYVMGASGAEEQERYAIQLAALPVIALGAALFRRETWLIGTAIVGLLCARAIAVEAVDHANEPLSYFFSPAESLFTEHADMTIPLALLLVALGMLTCLAPQYERAWHRNVNVPGTGVVVGLVVFGLVCGIGALHRYEPATAPGDLDAYAWVDAAIGDSTAMFWNFRWDANAADRDVLTRRSLYFNRSLCCGEASTDILRFVHVPGYIERRGSDPDDPDYLVGHTGYRQLAFAAREVSRPVVGGVTMRLERFVRFPGGRRWAAAVVHGAGEDGVVETRARIEALRGLRGACVDVELFDREDAAATTRFSAGREHGTLRPDEVRWIRIDRTTVVRRSGGDAPLYIGELRYVGCEDPPSR